jgi:hypothetical protein
MEPLLLVPLQLLGPKQLATALPLLQLACTASMSILMESIIVSLLRGLFIVLTGVYMAPLLLQTPQQFQQPAPPH